MNDEKNKPHNSPQPSPILREGDCAPTSPNLPSGHRHGGVNRGGNDSISPPLGGGVRGGAGSFSGGGERNGTWQALSLAWELGYTIAAPIVAFALGGRLLDRKLETSPWLLLTGIFLSLIISSWLVYFKMVKIIGK